MSLRLINPQPLATLPEEGSIWVEYVNGSIFRTQATATREEYEISLTGHRIMNPPIAWSYTATTEPIVVSRGYELPPGMGWRPIESLTIELLMEYRDRPQRLMFLIRANDPDEAYLDGTEPSLTAFINAIIEEDAFTITTREVLDVLRDPDNSLIAYRVIHPLRRVES